MYTVDQLKDAIVASECITDVCRALNITVCDYNYKRIKRLCDENDISRAHFNVKKSFTRNKFQWDEHDVFCVASTVPRHRLRALAVKFGLYTGCCSSCGLGEEWNGAPITLELDHINGINDDNRKDNLRWLCPNCHSQTPTFRNSRNRK